MNDNETKKDTERILEGPSIRDTVMHGLVEVNSHPLLLLFWLVTSTAIVLFNRMTLDIYIKAPLFLVSGILALFLMSGVMGSMELIIREKGWILAAVWYCAKLYFPRFILLGIILVITFFILYIPAYVILEYYLGPPYFPEKDTLYILFAAATVIGLLMAAFYMTFASSSIVIGNLLPLEAIERSFKIVMANRMKVLYLWLVFVGSLAAVELVFNILLGVEWRGKLVQNAILSYLMIIMLMSVMYFNFAVTSRADLEIEYEA